MINKIKKFFKDKVIDKIKGIFQRKSEKIGDTVIIEYKLPENSIVEEEKEIEKIAIDESNNVKDVNKEELNINKRTYIYLSGVTYTIKDSININKKLEKIKKEEEDVVSLNEFLDKNNNVSNDKKLLLLIDEICTLIKKREKILLEKSKNFVKFMASNNMECVEEISKLYEKIISLDNYDQRINILNDYIDNNKSATDEIALLNEMELLLKNDVDFASIEKMNKLEAEMQTIDEELEYEIVKGAYTYDQVTPGAYFYDVKKVDMLRKKYNDLKNEVSEIDKQLHLKK